MMGFGTMGTGGFMSAGGYGMGLFGGAIWILLMIYLILGIAYFWKQLTEKK